MTHPIVDLFRIALRHRGDRAAILAELEAEKEWARFCARHGLPRDTDRTGHTDGSAGETA